MTTLSIQARRGRVGFAKLLVSLGNTGLTAIAEGNTEISSQIAKTFVEIFNDRGRMFGVMDNTLDTGYRGEGNKAYRRQAGESINRSCGCTVCTVYGGDCSYQMWMEGHSQWHREQRGTKTKLSRREPIVFFNSSTDLAQKFNVTGELDSMEEDYYNDVAMSDYHREW